MPESNDDSTLASRSPEVFVSYASLDRARVVRVADELEKSGVSIWRDADRILGGEQYGPKIVEGIRHSKVMIIMCTEASMRSKNVRQEIMLAWKYNCPYLPLLLDQISFSDQTEYFLEGSQWIEVCDHPADRWLARVLMSLETKGVRHCFPGLAPAPAPVLAKMTVGGLAGLRRIASFTDEIWPLPAEHVPRGVIGPWRDLGEPQDHVNHFFRMGDAVQIAIEVQAESHLLLLDQGASGKVYCLCPSAFAPDTLLRPGRNILPQPSSPYPAFLATGKPGREHLLALLTQGPIGLDLMSGSPRVPARVLSDLDIEVLIKMVHALPEDSWVALSTFFDILPAI